MTVKHIARLLALSTLISATLEAIPKATPTMLPFPENLLDSEVDMIKEIIALEVYQDNNDPNQYFYIPPFHIRQYAEGAATHSPHSNKIINYAEAAKIMRDRSNYDKESIREKKQEIQKMRDSIIDLEDKLDKAIAEKNNLAIETYERRIVERKNGLEELKLELQDTIKESIKRADEAASVHLSLTGFNVDLTRFTNSDDALQALKDAAAALGDSYGGFLSVNTYAGFTQKQLQALRAYKQKYFPDIKVSLMPMEKLTFSSLTNLDPDGQPSSNGQRYFTNITGAGDYLGAAISLDTSVGSGTGMEQHLGAFVLPVAIKGTRRHKAYPFEAKLTCDFSSGFAVKGRADIRDGLIIYDNDITNNIKTEDVSDGACKLEVISGDQTSAEIVAMKEIASQLEKIHVYRTNLSQQEKTRYFDGVLNDLNRNRRSNSRQEKISYVYNRHGLRVAVIETISRAADFHWHTNIQDVSNISNLKFSKHIKLEGDTNITRDIGINLCLVYNPAHKAYDRCTDLEEASANNMQKAMQEAQNFPGCESAASPMDCGQIRNDSLRLPEGMRRQYNYDTSLVGNI